MNLLEATKEGVVSTRETELQTTIDQQAATLLLQARLIGEERDRKDRLVREHQALLAEQTRLQQALDAAQRRTDVLQGILRDVDADYWAVLKNADPEAVREALLRMGATLARHVKPRATSEG